MNPNKYHALLLSSDQQLSESLMQIILEDGGSISTLPNFADALGYLESQSPDFVFLDLKFTEAECLNLMRRLKQISPALPLFTVGFGLAGEPDAALHAFGLGLNDFIQLPVEDELIRAQLAGLLQSKQRLEEMTRRQRELTDAC